MLTEHDNKFRRGPTTAHGYETVSAHEYGLLIHEFETLMDHYNGGHNLGWVHHRIEELSHRAKHLLTYGPIKVY